MTRMNIDEIHAINLVLLKHIHEFCVNHNIRYVLGYGTLIGAVRHRGFIPWDDDSDILMPREDYNRFIKEYSDSDKYHLYAPEKGDSLLIYARLCEMQETYFCAESRWAMKGNPGVGIDIFPLDNVPDDENESRAVQSQIYDAETRIWHLRNVAFLNVCIKSGWNRICKRLIRFLIHMPHIIIWRRELRQLMTLVHRLIAMSGKQISNHVGNLTVPIYPQKERLPAQWFDKRIEVPFCGVNLSIPREFDKILRNYYGDYMKIPDRDQIRTHESIQVLFWRNK